MTDLRYQDYPHHFQAIIQAALAAANPYDAVAKHIRREGQRLSVGKHQHRLDNGRLFLVSIGKAAVPMAQAVVDQLGETAVLGGIVSKHLPQNLDLPLPAFEGSHPVPDEKSIQATAAVLQTLAQTNENDLVLCLISGGASALFSQPHLPLATWQQLNRTLLASGCTIQEMNTVRRQLDRVKAGGLAHLAAPARVLSLILSDVVGNELLAIGSGPTTASSERPSDAQAVLARHQTAAGMETAVYQTIETKLAELSETAVSPPTNILGNHIVGSIRQSAEAAAACAQNLGFDARLLTVQLEGEAREVGKITAALAKDSPAHSATILGGETTVTLRGSGRGGRNLETALAAAISLAGWPNRAIASFATDGDDGPTGMAGAMITGETVQSGALAWDYLNQNDSFSYFKNLKSSGVASPLIDTGPTGTNVNDLLIILRY